MYTKHLEEKEKNEMPEYLTTVSPSDIPNHKK